MKKLAIMLLLITTVYGQNKVPNIRLKMLDGKYAKLYDLLKEGPILVDFWARKSRVLGSFQQMFVK